MKQTVKIVLILFLSFIAMPTIVSIVDKKVDTAYFYNMTEEEENLPSYDDLKMVHYCLDSYSNIIESRVSKKIFIMLDDNVKNCFSSTILLPPPELI